MNKEATKRPLIYDLPVISTEPVNGWNVKRLCEFADVIGGATPDTSKSEFWQPAEIPWATPTDITACEGTTISSTARSISKLGLASCSTNLIPENSCLMTSRATVGECRMNTVPMTTNQGFASLVPKSETDPYFLFYLAAHIKPAVVRLASGTTFAEVSRTEIRRIRCRVPLLQEQKAIGALLLKAESAIASKELELTAAQRLKTALMQQLFTRGIPGRHAKWQKLRVFRNDYEIPSAWEAARLKSCISLIEYGTNEPGNSEKLGLPVVAIPQVISPRFTLADCDYAQLSDNEAAALRLAPDDVLLIRTNGNSEYIGKSTVIGDEADRQHIVYASYLIRVRSNPDRLLGRYLNYFLHSPLGKRQTRATANTSAGNHNLGIRAIKQFWIPRPEKDEQKEIVGLLDSVEDLLDSLSVELEKIQCLKTSLLQNLLTGKVRVKMEN
ncbi:MAG: restriction endonuclease subunit S [Verrucomicrobiia bacterium]